MVYSKMNESDKATKIASETYKLFPVGCVVRRRNDPSKQGIVEGHGMGGFATYGFVALSCLKVKWSGNKTAAILHRDFVERVVPVKGRPKIK